MTIKVFWNISCTYYFFSALNQLSKKCGPFKSQTNLCLIFDDVDMIPLNSQIPYDCSKRFVITHTCHFAVFFDFLSVNSKCKFYLQNLCFFRKKSSKFFLDQIFLEQESCIVEIFKVILWVLVCSAF